MSVVKLKPNVKDYIWGGNYFQDFGKGAHLARASECWELSFNLDNECYDADTGKKLNEVVLYRTAGPAATKFPFFPVLIKLIDAKENLSIQVHPSDEYAFTHEHNFGKEEVWHILSAEEGSGLYVGFNQDYNKEEIYQSLKDGTIISKLNFFHVKPGDTFVIKPGTVHAIGAGVRLIEIQQNSTLTYRLYDYLRKDDNGQYRELHIDKAIEVLNFKKYVPENITSSCLAKCQYFTSNRVEVTNGMIVSSGLNSFKSITFISGKGTINGIPYSMYDSFYIPYNEKANIQGDGVFIETYVE